MARLNDFKLKYGLINAEAHRRIARRRRLARLDGARARGRAYRHARPAAGAQRVQPQRHPHPERAALEGQPPLSNLPSLCSMGIRFFAEEFVLMLKSRPRQVGGPGRRRARRLAALGRAAEVESDSGATR